jgi:hypothetical protein
VIGNAIHTQRIGGRRAAKFKMTRHRAAVFLALRPPNAAHAHLLRVNLLPQLGELAAQAGDCLPVGQLVIIRGLKLGAQVIAVVES